MLRIQTWTKPKSHQPLCPYQLSPLLLTFNPCLHSSFCSYTSPSIAHRRVTDDHPGGVLILPALPATSDIVDCPFLPELSSFLRHHTLSVFPSLPSFPATPYLIGPLHVGVPQDFVMGALLPLTALPKESHLFQRLQIPSLCKWLPHLHLYFRLLFWGPG